MVGRESYLVLVGEILLLYGMIVDLYRNVIYATLSKGKIITVITCDSDAPLHVS